MSSVTNFIVNQETDTRIHHLSFIQYTDSMLPQIDFILEGILSQKIWSRY